MKTKFLFILTLVGILISGALAFASLEDITYPISELGNCLDQESCFAYCEDSVHLGECLSFAEENDLLDDEEIERGQEFKEALERGDTPGGCSSPDACEAYCSDITHLEECLAFAESSGLTDENVEDGRKMLEYLRGGGQMPGGCTSHETCEAYCSDFNHIDECLAFAEELGIKPEHDGEEFDLEKIRQVVKLMRNGETPGGCQSKESCEAYCRGGEHFEECLAFGERLGFISPDEAEMFRRTGGKGPGGCDSEESCSAFCNDPANQETCFEFGREHGLVSEDDLRRIEEGREAFGAFEEHLGGEESFPPEIAECLSSVGGTNIIEQIRAGTLLPSPEIGETMKRCFENFTPPGEFREGEFEHTSESSPERSFPPPGEFRPPEGISPEEYQRYYEEHPEEFQSSEGFQQAGDQVQNVEYQRQYEAEYREQYEVEHREQSGEYQYQSLPEVYVPPPVPPPTESYPTSEPTSYPEQYQQQTRSTLENLSAGAYYFFRAIFY